MNQITYSIRVSRRARSLRITIHTGGEVVATRPHYVSEAQLESFIAAKKAWIIKHVAKRQTGNSDLNNRTREHYLSNREAARALVRLRIEALNQTYDFKIAGISIRKLKTRWGSCSSRGRLNFNYKILFLPQQLQDYLIVHELCHLRQMNHSAAFWDLVALRCPNFRELNRQLKQN